MAKAFSVRLRFRRKFHNYTKPELVMDTFLRWMGEEPLPFAYMIERREIYANKGDEEHLKLVSMEALGEKAE